MPPIDVDYKWVWFYRWLCSKPYCYRGSINDVVAEYRRYNSGKPEASAWTLELCNGVPWWESTAHIESSYGMSSMASGCTCGIPFSYSQALANLRRALHFQCKAKHRLDPESVKWSSCIWEDGCGEQIGRNLYRLCRIPFRLHLGGLRHDGRGTSW